ncbi:MAG: hypothetical protein WCJ30_03960, partial [Deltaproteobacteria bacterium]
HADRDLPDPFATGPAAASWVSRLAGGGDLVRARTALDLVASGLGHVRLVDDPHDAPASRAIDDVIRALATADGRVTSLDIARLVAGLLRAAGTRARVAEITAGMRPGEPADPSAMLGRYVALVGDTAVDTAGHTLLPARELHAVAIDDGAVRGAMLAQSALNAAYGGAQHDRVLGLADGAVAAWRDGVVPLAVRAEAWRIAGSTGGLSLADQDLASAIAMRDEAPLHVLRARFALLAGRGDLAGTEIRAALARSRGFGPAALAAAIAGIEAVDGGDRCRALHESGDPWTPFAWTVCRGDAPAGAISITDAARQLATTSTDPMQLAYAAAAGAEGVFARVRGTDRDELAAWLSALGRSDLARDAGGSPRDAGR